MATAAEIAGVDSPPDTDSVSFLPAILGDKEKQEKHRYLYWEFYGRGSAQAVRAGQWKAVRKPIFLGDIELYNLSKDLGEEKNVADQNSEVVDEMKLMMEEAHTPSELWKVNE